MVYKYIYEPDIKKIESKNIISIEKNGLDFKIKFYIVEPPRDKDGNVDYEEIKNEGCDIDDFEFNYDTKEEQKLLIYMRDNYLYICEFNDIESMVYKKDYKIDEYGNDYIKSQFLDDKIITTDNCINNNIEILYCWDFIS